VEKLSRFLALEGNIRILAVQTLLGQIGLGMFYVIWQPYMLSTGITLPQLGLVQTVINISTGIGLFFWGYISDRYGRKPVIIATLICRVISIAFLIVSDSFWAFMGFAVFMGLTALFYMGNPARSALITESVDQPQRATAMSTLMTIMQGTSTVVATIGGYIALEMGYAPIFYIMVIGDTIGTLYSYLYLKETLKNNNDQNAKISISDRLRNTFAPEHELIRLYAGLLVMGFSYTVAYSLLYGALSEKFGLTTVELGLMTTAFNLTLAVGSIPMGKIVDRIGRRKGMLTSMTMAMVTPIGFILFHRFEFFVLFYAVSALDMGFWVPAYSSYITETVSQDKRSMVFGKIDAYGKLGSLPAAWLAGVIYEQVGFYVPFYIQIAACFFVSLLILGLKEPEKP
jgi:MFS family permease